WRATPRPERRRATPPPGGRWGAPRGGSRPGRSPAGRARRPPSCRPAPSRRGAPRSSFPRAGAAPVARSPGPAPPAPPGARRAAPGDDLAVTARIAPRFAALGGRAPDTAWVEWTDEATGRTRRVAMTASDEATSPGPGARSFRAALPRLWNRSAYRVVAGGAA